MELSDAGLRQQPFRTHGRPVVAVTYAGQAAAIQFLATTCAHRHGLGLFQGPPLSGKSTIIQLFIDSLDADTAFAFVNGAGSENSALLQDILRQFGYDLHFNKVTELLKMLQVFVVQQAASNHPPLLIVKNTQVMTPEALGTLCELAALKVHQKSALRLVLASDRDMAAMVKAPAMSCIAKRVTGRFVLQPMSEEETKRYIHEKMEAAGCKAPETVFPGDVCARLHSRGGGWPGVIDRLALLAFAKASSLPVTADLIERAAPAQNLPALIESIDKALEAEAWPKLFVTYNGATTHELTLDQPRLLVGRSEHNELRISSRFISRHHALFVRHDKATFLMDLNSTNGTFVNSRRISNIMLRNDDVVLIGNHRMKFVDPSATGRASVEDVGLSETVVMRNLTELRQLLEAEEGAAEEGAERRAADGG